MNDERERYPCGKPKLERQGASQSFTPEQVTLLSNILDTLLRGGDARQAARWQVSEPKTPRELAVDFWDTCAQHDGTLAKAYIDETIRRRDEQIRKQERARVREVLQKLHDWPEHIGRLFRLLNEVRVVGMDAVQKWGPTSQVDMAIEEMAELIAALNREQRGRSTEEAVQSEIADVLIMMMQLLTMYEAGGVIDAVAAKTNRLRGRVLTDD